MESSPVPPREAVKRDGLPAEPDRPGVREDRGGDAEPPKAELTRGKSHRKVARHQERIAQFRDRADLALSFHDLLEVSPDPLTIAKIHMVVTRRWPSRHAVGEQAHPQRYAEEHRRELPGVGCVADEIEVL